MRKNLMMYNGKQESIVIAHTFHRKSHDEMKSKSETFQIIHLCYLGIPTLSGTSTNTLTKVLWQH